MIVVTTTVGVGQEIRADHAIAALTAMAAPGCPEDHDPPGTFGSTWPGAKRRGWRWKPDTAEVKGTAVSEPVVVGIDHSEHSAHTADVAAAEAMACGRPLRLVHVFRWLPAPGEPGAPFEEGPMDEARAGFVNRLEDAATRLREDHPGLDVETMPMEGDPPRLLAEAARGAALLVVGGRGYGGFTGMLLGSTVLRVLELVDRPVLVVRDAGRERARTGRIMVGVDPLAPRKNSAALEFAFAEAAARKAEVYAIYVWEEPAHLLGPAARLSTEGFAEYEELQRAHLAEIVAPFEQAHPAVNVVQQAFPGTVSKTLVESTELADALVIGGTVTSGKKHAGMRIGPLAHVVLHHAHCTVFVIPEH